MKRWTLALALGFATVALVGCSAEEPKATPKDKENIDKIMKEGIGAPQDAQGGAQPGTAAPPDQSDP
ncbi:MAG: hypothetical protein H3C58_11675 [Fimbriimonadaceae bacterium]|nr:hypothetical protein [Fimbriimonadaceae bacterium]